jgi:ribonuclease-3
MVAIDGPPHARAFTARARIVLDAQRGDELTGDGLGKSKKLAEQAAARAVLQKLSALGDASAGGR